MKFLFALAIVACFSCNQKKVYKEVARTDKLDEDIVLIGVGDSTRTQIAALLLDIEKCSPAVVGIDIIFAQEKQSLEDSALCSAFENLKNDILAWVITSSGKRIRCIEKVRKFADAEGYLNFHIREGISSHFVPITNLDDSVYESFALKIFKKWRPDFKYDFAPDQSIPILFQRTLKQYYYFVQKDLLDSNVCNFLKNKIVLVGNLGPGNEDKHYTPIRSNDKDQEGKPDTYGLVIQANAIRTILEYEKK